MDNIVDLNSKLEDLSHPQSILKEALDKRDIKMFCTALKLGANPVEMGDMDISVLKQALQTHGCAEFVDECLKSECGLQNLSTTHKINIGHEKGLISYAADSQDPQILYAILMKLFSKPSPDCDEENVLISLCQKLEQNNSDDIYECIKILLSFGANPNKVSYDDITPLHRIVKNEKVDDLTKKEFIKLFLRHPTINIDTLYRGELRKLLEVKYPDIELPTIHEQDLITYDMLWTDLQHGNTRFFDNHYKHNLRRTTEEQNQELLLHSVEKGYHAALDIILETGGYSTDLNCCLKLNKVAVVCGNWYALEKLLGQPDIKLPKQNSLICDTIQLLNIRPQGFCDYWKCFSILLESNKTDINSLDLSKNTALHLGVKYRNTEAIKELLKRGANICIKNNANKLAIDGMSPKVLEEQLNDCIISYNDDLCDKKFSNIMISFNNFIPDNKSSQQLGDVLNPISFMTDSPEYQDLLQHPVVTSLLFLKWHKISLVFFINCLFYFFYSLSMSLYVVFKFRESGHETAEAITAILSWCGTIYLILRESLQLLVHPMRYILSPTNHLEIALIILSLMTCTQAGSRANQPYIAAFTILLASVEFCLILGYIPVPSISTHFLMLKAVCKSFWKSFLFYSILIITFSVSFYIMHDKSEKDEETFDNFPNLVVALVKTIVMLTGDLGTSDFDFKSCYTYIIFLLFVFCMTIILLNLLNGLAVKDTQDIQDQGKLNYLICRTHLLARYEQLLGGGAWIQAMLKFFPNPSDNCNSRNVILSYDNNKIVLPKSNFNEKITNHASKDDSTVLLTIADDSEKHSEKSFLRNRFHFITGKYSKIDKSTLILATNVLKKRNVENLHLQTETLDYKLKSFENKLKQNMKEKMDSIRDFIDYTLEGRIY